MTNIPIFSTLSNPLIISIIISPYSRYYRLPQRFSHLLTYLGPPSPTLSSFLHFISLIYLCCPLYYAIIPQTLLFQPSHNQAPPMDTPNSIHMYYILQKLPPNLRLPSQLDVWDLTNLRFPSWLDVWDLTNLRLSSWLDVWDLTNLRLSS